MRRNLLGILSSGLSSLTGFSLDVKVDQEKGGEEGSQKNGEVGSKLNFKGEGLGREGLDDGVNCEGRGGDSSDGDGSDGSLLNGLLGNCVKYQREIVLKRSFGEEILNDTACCTLFG